MECNIQHKKEIILRTYSLALSKLKEVINFKSAIQVIEMHSLHFQKLVHFHSPTIIPCRCLLRVFEVVNTKFCKMVHLAAWGYYTCTSPDACCSLTMVSNPVTEDVVCGIVRWEHCNIKVMK